MSAPPERGLRMVNWESQSKTPPRVRKTDTFVVFDLFVLHSVTCLRSCNFTVCLTSLSIFISVFRVYVNTARDVVRVTVLLVFATYLSLYLHIFTCTYRGTHTQARMYNQHTRGMATNRHRSLVERGRRKAFVRDKGLAHTQKENKKCQKKSELTS